MRHETLTDDDDDDDEPGGNHEQPYSDTSRQNSGVHSDQRSPAESKLRAFIRLRCCHGFQLPQRPCSPAVRTHRRQMCRVRRAA
jgi:hypothetical protein